MFLVCGEALFDMFGDFGREPGTGEVLYRAVAGGSPLNVAVGLARLGREVALSTELFDDHLGRRLEDILKGEGVDLAFARRSSGATPLALVEIDRAGVPHYAFHGLDRLQVHPEASAGEDPRWSGIHVGSIPIVSERSGENLLSLISKGSDLLISFDPNVRLAVQPDTRLWAEQIDRFRQKAHLIKVSVEDVEATHGCSADPEELSASWIEGGTQVVVLTRGAAGSVLFSRQAPPITVRAVPTDVIDTVGAGDSFMAGLLCWLDEEGYARADGPGTLDADQLRSMVEFASQAAARTCSRRGPDLPQRAEIAPPGACRSRRTN